MDISDKVAHVLGEGINRGLEDTLFNTGVALIRIDYQRGMPNILLDNSIRVMCVFENYATQTKYTNSRDIAIVSTVFIDGKMIGCKLAEDALDHFKILRGTMVGNLEL